MLKFLYRSITFLSTILLLLFLGLAFSPLPKQAEHWLKTSARNSVNPPKIIVVLGGGGIPSKSGLLRCYTAAEIYQKNSQATIIVALPSDTNPEQSSTGRMRDELVLRGVPASSIEMETTGRSTAEQAKAIATMVGREGLFKSVLIVTDPSHMRRSIQSFKKAGFVDLKSGPSLSVSADADAGSNTLFRYGVWNNLHLEIECLREFIALQWYKHKGWI